MRTERATDFFYSFIAMEFPARKNITGLKGRKYARLRAEDEESPEISLGVSKQNVFSVYCHHSTGATNYSVRTSLAKISLKKKNKKDFRGLSPSFQSTRMKSRE